MSIANELITRGWHQGDYMSEDGRVCLYGAAMCAAGFEAELVAGGVTKELTDEELAVMRAVGSECRAGEVVSFNDAAGRTFDEVLRVAKEADEILEAS